MSVDVSHLVLVALGDADDEVVDERTDGSEGGDVLACAVVHLDVDDIGLRGRECDCDMAQVLGELATGALDGDLAGLDVDLDCWTGSVSISSSCISFLMSLLLLPRLLLADAAYISPPQPDIMMLCTYRPLGPPAIPGSRCTACWASVGGAEEVVFGELVVFNLEVSKLRTKRRWACGRAKPRPIGAAGAGASSSLPQRLYKMHEAEYIYYSYDA